MKFSPNNLNFSKAEIVRLYLWPAALAMTVSLAGFALWEPISPFNQTRLLQLALLFWVSSLLVFNRVVSGRVIQSISTTRIQTLLWVAAFWILGLIAALNAQWPSFALQDWAHYLLLVLSVLAVANLASQHLQRSVKILMAGIVFGISLALTRFVTQVILTLSLNVVTPLAQWWSPYANPRFIAQALIWIIPLLTVLPTSWPAFRKRSHIATHALCSGVWMLLFWTGSRAELASLVLSMGLVAVLMWRQAFSFLSRMTLHALTGCALWLLTRMALSVGVAGGGVLSLARSGVSGRDWLMELSLHLMAQHPWLGVGPAHFSAYNFNSSFPSAHPHNLILQIAAEWGLPAAVLVIYLLWKFVRYQYHYTQQPLARFDSTINLRYALRIPLLLTLFAVIFTSMLDGIHVMPLSLLVGVPVLGLMIAINTPTQNQNLPPHRAYAEPSIATLVMFCWGILLLSIFQQRDCLTYPIQAEHLINARVIEDHPRFWLQGRMPIGTGCLEISRYRNGVDTLLNRSVDASSSAEQYWR